MSQRTIDLLNNVAEYLGLHADVMDGPDGEPRANSAMHLLREVDEEIASLEKAVRPATPLT